MSTEPVSILKNPNTNATTEAKLARIALSDDEDGDEDEQPMSAEALELLKTEKVIKASYLLKKGEKRRTWKKRWFVLKSTKLAMYKDNKEYKLLRIIDLHEIHKVVQVTTKNKYKHVFALVTPKRMYYVQANDQNDMEDWFTLLNTTKKQQNTDTIDHEYPQSPSFDQQVMDSSDEEEEYTTATKPNDNRVLIEGYLLKLGRNKGWRKRWFVLRTDTLAYYQDDKEYSPHRIIPLDRIIDSLEIEPISKHKQFCFKIIIPKRSYVLCASSEDDMDAWLNALVVASSRVKQQSVESLDSFENVSQISGAGGVGGAGGALGVAIPTNNLAHLASERLGRAK